MHKISNFDTSLRKQLILHTLICLIPLSVAVLFAVLHWSQIAVVLAILSIGLAGFALYRLQLYFNQAFTLMLKTVTAPSEAQTMPLSSEFETLTQSIKHYYGPQLAQLRTEITILEQYQSTLDQLDSAIMLLDAQGRIIESNACCRNFINTHATALAALVTDNSKTSKQAISLPAFLGQPDLLTGMETQPVDKIVKMDVTTFNLHLVPLQNRTWLVVWTDISARFATEEQLQKSIGKAITGDFKGRITLDQQQGFMLGLGKGFNMLMDSVQEPLQETVKVQQLLADGDLTHKLDGFYLGEFATVKSAINQSIDKLLEVVKKVNQVSSSIHQNLVEINQHNAEINDRFNNQNDSLTQAAASLEQMTASVKQNSDHTNRTNALATKAHQQADFGNSISIKLMSAMKDINDASLKVVDISNVIDEIAFQTKLLALNAAVEAARAGEHGRGFKVVASEVQNLAQRSAEAAKEIKSLVIDNMAKIKTGSEFVHQTDHALTSILQDSETVNQLVGEISTAIQEEYIGINQINRVVLNIQTIAEDNTHAVNFVMNLSEEAKQQAESLSQLMAFFNTGEQRHSEGFTVSETSPSKASVNIEVNTRSSSSTVMTHEEPSEDDFFI